MELIVKIQTEEQEKDRYYPCECKYCGWIGSSGNADGGGQIADTGDYDDVICPVCGSRSVDETDNEQPIQSFIERLDKAHKAVKFYREKASECDCLKHIYGDFEQRVKELEAELKQLKP